MLEALLTLCLNFHGTSTCECLIRHIAVYEVDISVEELPRDILFKWHEECVGNEA